MAQWSWNTPTIYPTASMKWLHITIISDHKTAAANTKASTLSHTTYTTTNNNALKTFELV